MVRIERTSEELEARRARQWRWLVYRLHHHAMPGVYIGITLESLEKRLRGHIQDAESEASASLMAAWLKASVYTPQMDEIDQIYGTRNQAERREKQWIWHTVQHGEIVLNTLYVPTSSTLMLLRLIPDNLLDDRVFDLIEVCLRASEAIGSYEPPWRIQALEEATGLLSQEFTRLLIQPYRSLSDRIRKGGHA